MRAVVLTAPGELRMAEQPEVPGPGPGQVLVAVRRVGICGTDYHAYGGRQNFVTYPCILGHELAVEVLAAGHGVAGLAPGQACAVLPYLSCGACPMCQAGRTNGCERIQVLGVTQPGGLQEHMIVSAGQLFPADGLSFDQLVLVETLGIGWHAVCRGEVGPDDVVAVLGAGPVGLAVAQAARLRSPHVVLADVSPQRVEFASSLRLDAVLVRSTQGREPQVLARDDAAGPLLSAVQARTDGALPSVVLDASGSRTSMEAAFSLTGPGGRLVLVGHTTGSLRFGNPGFHSRELTVLASRNATRHDWEGVIEAVQAGTVDAASWINHRTSLDAVVDGLPALAARPGEVVKAVVHLGPDQP